MNQETECLRQCVQMLMDIISNELTEPKCLEGDTMTEECALSLGKDDPYGIPCDPDHCPLHSIRQKWFAIKGLLKKVGAE